MSPPESLGVRPVAPDVLLGAQGAELFDNSPAPMLILDRSRRIRLINQAGATMIGGSRENLVGLTLGDVLLCAGSCRTPWGCGGVSECATCSLRESVDLCIRTGQESRDRSFDVRGVQEGAPADIRLRFSSVPLVWGNARMALVTVIGGPGLWSKLGC